MSLQDSDARQRWLQEKMQLLNEQHEINKKRLAIMDEQDQLQKVALAAIHQQAPSRIQTEPARQQQTPSSRKNSANHQPVRRASEQTLQSLHQVNEHTAGAGVSALGNSTQEVRKRKKKRSSQSLNVLGSDSDSDDRPLLPRKRKNRKTSAPKTETSREAPHSTAPTSTTPPPVTPASTAPASTAAAFTALASTAPTMRPPAEKYKIFRRTPDYKYDMIVVVGDQVVELACCFCHGNHFKHGAGWKAIVGVHGLQKHIQLSHKEDEHENLGKRGFDWVVQNCVRKILLKSEIEDVEDGTHYVREVHVHTTTHPH